MQPQSGVVEANGATLYYEVAGDGPPLVLIHGFALDRRMWDAQMDALAARARVIRYDLRGFGLSSAPGGQPYRHTDDLAALMDHLGVERADLVGLSLGGAVAIDFTLAFPDRVRALIVLDSVLNGFDWSEENKARDRAVYQQAREAGIEAGKQTWLAHPLFSPLMSRPEAASLFKKILDDYSGWHFVNRNPLIFENPPAAQRLAEIGAATLALVGALDLPDFRRVADALAEGIPGSRKVVIDGVGHMPNMEAPPKVNALILEFLSALDGKAAGA